MRQAHPFLVYTVVGGAEGSGVSRISEKVDIRNTTGEAITFRIGGMGCRPTGGAHQQNLEVPDIAGLNVTGTSVAYIQGRTGATSLIDAPFAPFELRPVVGFSGFNTHSEEISLPAGATLTMITEIRIGATPPTTGDGASGDVTGGGTTGGGDTGSGSTGDGSSGGPSPGTGNGSEGGSSGHAGKHGENGNHQGETDKENGGGGAISNPLGG